MRVANHSASVRRKEARSTCGKPGGEVHTRGYRFAKPRVLLGAGALAPCRETAQDGHDDKGEGEGERGEAPRAQRIAEDDVFERCKQVFHAPAL